MTGTSANFATMKDLSVKDKMTTSQLVKIKPKVSLKLIKRGQDLSLTTQNLAMSHLTLPQAHSTLTLKGNTSLP